LIYLAFNALLSHSLINDLKPH